MTTENSNHLLQCIIAKTDLSINELSFPLNFLSEKFLGKITTIYLVVVDWHVQLAVLMDIDILFLRENNR